MHSNPGPRLAAGRGWRSPTGGGHLLAPALLAFILALATVAPAQAERPRVYAIVGATIITAPGSVVESGTVVIRDGLIEAVGLGIEAPADAEVIDGEGLTVYAGWIDAYSHLGMKPAEGGDGGGGFNIAALFRPSAPQQGTGHPIELVHPQYRVTSELVGRGSELKKRRELGFTAALAVPRDGIFRGWSALIALRDGSPRDLVIKPLVAQHVGFDTGSFFGGYPSNILGTIATIRQVHYDTLRYIEWTERYRSDPSGMPRPAYNDAMEALAQADRPFIVQAGSNRQIERALRLAEEFQGVPIIVGGGTEYEIIDLLAGTDSSFIIPVNYPDEPDVSNPDRLPSVSLQSLQRWENAPGNAAALQEAGITFALTPYGMSNPTKFTDNVRKAIEAGLSEDAALAALTTVPATLLGVAASMGTVETGKIANLVVATGSPFAEDTKIRHVFVDGYDFEIKEKEQIGDPDAVVDPRGEWAVTVTVMGNTQNATWTIEGSKGNYKGHSVSDRGEVQFDSVTLEGNALTVVIPQPGGRGTLEATVVIEGEEFEGSASFDARGRSITIKFKGERTSGPEGGER